MVGVFASAEKLIVIVLGQVNTVITKLGSLEMVAVWMSKDALHRRSVDFVGDREVVDGVSDLIVLHHINSTL